MNAMQDHIEIRGAKAHNLKNIDVDIPLGKIVAAGTPRDVAGAAESVTARFLRPGRS